MSQKAASIFGPVSGAAWQIAVPFYLASAISRRSGALGWGYGVRGVILQGWPVMTCSDSDSMQPLLSLPGSDSVTMDGVFLGPTRAFFVSTQGADGGQMRNR